MHRRVGSLAIALWLASVGAGCGSASSRGRDAEDAGDALAALGMRAATGAAIAPYERALALWIENGDRAGQARVHAALGAAFAAIDDVPAARAHLDQAIAIGHALGDADRELSATAERATLGGHDDDARAVTELAALAQTARARGALDAEAIATARQGQVLLDEERHADATAVLTRALPLAQARRDVHTEAAIEESLGEAAYDVGDTVASQAHLRRAHALARLYGEPALDAYVTFLDGATDMWILRKTQPAIPRFERAIDELGRAGELGRVLEVEVALAWGKTDRADDAGAARLLESIAATAARVGDAGQEASALSSLGLAYRGLHQFDRALAAYARASAIAQAHGLDHEFNSALIGEARVDVLLRRWPDAATNAKAFIARVEKEEAALPPGNARDAVAGATRNGIQILVQAYAGQGQWSDAFEESERLHARHLLDELAPGAPPIGIAEAQALLDPDTQVVAFAHTDKETYAWVIGAGSVEGFDLGLSSDLGAFGAGLVDGGYPTPTEPELRWTLAFLSARLIAPLVPSLKAKRLVIVPDRFLYTVPFAALPLADGTPLGQRFDLAVTPSMSVLAALRRRGSGRAPPTSQIAVIADPVFASDDARIGGDHATAVAMLSPGDVPLTRAAHASGLDALARVPFTRDEADAIAALAGAGNSFVALDTSANRAALAAPEVAHARIVHIATHGLVDTDHPEDSGLVLSLVDASGHPADGFVRAGDLSKLELRADLVVLSACRTAQGRFFAGEGVIDLTRAFFVAGATHVISTLWPVDDAATARLMHTFYVALLRDKLSPAAALRRAQTALAADPRYHSARYWAAFVLYGDAR